MRKTIYLFTLMLWGVTLLFTSCSESEADYRSVTDNIDPATIEKSAFSAYFPLESQTYTIIKGRGIDSSKVVVGGTAKFVPGQRGFAYRGDSLSKQSYLTLPVLSNTFLKDAGLNEFTLSCWTFLPKATNNKVMSIFQIDGGDTYYGALSLSIDSLNLIGAVFNKNNDSTYVVSTLRSAVKSDVWVHLVFTYNQTASKLAIYANGILQKEVDCYVSPGLLLDALALSQTMTKVYIGAWPQQLNNTATSSMTYFNGKLDEIRMWKKCLSKNAVDSLYNAEQALSGK